MRKQILYVLLWPLIRRMQAKLLVALAADPSMANETIARINAVALAMARCFYGCAK